MSMNIYVNLTNSIGLEKDNLKVIPQQFTIKQQSKSFMFSVT